MDSEIKSMHEFREEVAGTRTVGGFGLTRCQPHHLWIISRLDGEPVPKNLKGFWTSASDAIAAIEKLSHGR